MNSASEVRFRHSWSRLLALDLTESILAQAIDAGADMIITHHPMIFEGQKKINNHTFTGRRILSLIKHNIQYYAMHTNYDILGMEILVQIIYG